MYEGMRQEEKYPAEGMFLSKLSCQEQLGFHPVEALWRYGECAPESS